MWVSEMGDTETLRGLLAHADRYMNPTWARGAFYYPRNDQSYDADGNMTFMDPVTGNAMLAYARLNVRDGMWSLYNRPFTPTHFREPALEGVTGDADVLGARFVVERQQLQLAVRGRGGKGAQATLLVANLPTDRAWVARHEGRVVARSGGERRDPLVRIPVRLTAATTRVEVALT